MRQNIEINIITSLINKASRSRKLEKKKYYFTCARIFAAKKLATRYANIKEYISDEFVRECIEVLSSLDTTDMQKMAGRIVLDLKFGKVETNKMIEKFAIVHSRKDILVRKWAKKVLERDNYKCVECGSDKSLETHHISHWSCDPANRINIDNGITLCKKCHSEEHPAIAKFISR